MKKRVFSLFITVCLLVSMVSVNAFAEEPAPETIEETLMENTETLNEENQEPEQIPEDFNNKEEVTEITEPVPLLTEKTESSEEYLQTDSLPAELEETGSLSTAPTGVSYLYPIYKTAGDPASGVASWSTGNAAVYTPVTASDTFWGSADTTTWYVADGTVSIDNSVKVYGNVNLILFDECELTITGPETNPDYTKAGINVTGTNTLTIYAQSTDGDMGSLTAIGGTNGGAGIGSNRVGAQAQVPVRTSRSMVEISPQPADIPQEKAEQPESAAVIMQTPLTLSLTAVSSLQQARKKAPESEPQPTCLRTIFISTVESSLPKPDPKEHASAVPITTAAAFLSIPSIPSPLATAWLL